MAIPIPFDADELESQPGSQLQLQNKFISSAIQKHASHTVTPVTYIDLEKSSENGLDYILYHFQDSQWPGKWPRTISTKATGGRQTVVHSKEEALAYFKAANYFDCRISAYPYWRSSPVSKFVGIKNPVAPDLVMIDLDICNFQSDYRMLKTALQKTLQKIKQRLSFKPTVIWSGNGFHIYVPINARALEDVKEFTNAEQVSTKFLRFAEWYLSWGKSDSAHNTTVSLNNCMLRIPGTINSKNNAHVRIVRRWDGTRPNINLLLGTFCAYLWDKKIKEQKVTTKIIESTKDGGSIWWIEQLLHTPINDHRKFAIWRILAPYLINVKGLSAEDTFKTIREWMDRCNQLKRLSFSPELKIKEGIRGALNGYRPISCEKLKLENNDLFQIVNEKQTSIN